MLNDFMLQHCDVGILCLNYVGTHLGWDVAIMLISVDCELCENSVQILLKLYEIPSIVTVWPRTLVPGCTQVNHTISYGVIGVIWHDYPSHQKTTKSPTRNNLLCEEA